MSDDICRTCLGTGYIKSHCDEPDRPCPWCNEAYTEEMAKKDAEELINMPKGVFDNE